MKAIFKSQAPIWLDADPGDKYVTSFEALETVVLLEYSDKVIPLSHTEAAHLHQLLTQALNLEENGK